MLHTHMQCCAAHMQCYAAHMQCYADHMQCYAAHMQCYAAPMQCRENKANSAQFKLYWAELGIFLPQSEAQTVSHCTLYGLQILNIGRG